MEVVIKYAYDGSYFYGFQRQNDRMTVQGEIEKVIKKTYGLTVNMVSSGRTDKKVHANMQVSMFEMDDKIPLEAIRIQINKILFGRVKVYEIYENTKEDFHPRYSAKKRVYEYRFKNKRNIEPFEYNYVSEINDKIKLDEDEIRKKLELFLGINNFFNYAKVDEDQTKFVREIFEVNCVCENGVYIATISGSGFLKSQIRLMMASCIYESENLIKSKLDLTYKGGPKKILSPNGLYLKEVVY